MAPQTTPWVPVSWGELLDKITILEIKRERIADPAARANVVAELGLLDAAAGDVRQLAQIATLCTRLKAVNERLWEIEDRIRAEDAAGRFGPRFLELARAVYVTNDERAALKRAISEVMGSQLVEEKSYARFGANNHPIKWAR